MRQLARRASLVVVLILLASVGTASAECACLPLRTFSHEERQQFETQYGVNWWKAMGLLPGPQTPGDWVDRPAGDSSITVFSPQQFWDPRACASSSTNPADPRGPKGK
jgi:hypothetical protein